MGLYTKQREYGETETKAGRKSDSYTRLLSSDEDDETTIWNSPLVGPEFRKESKKKKKVQEGTSFGQKCQGAAIVIVGAALIGAIYYVLGEKILRKFNAENKDNITSCGEDVNITGCPDSFPWHSYRLPKSIIPTHYDLFLHPNLTQGDYIGKVAINVMVQFTTSVILLHNRGLNITSLEVFSGMSSQGRGVLMSQDGKYDSCKEFDLVAVKLRENLRPGQEYRIQIAFEGELKKSLRGFYLSRYTTKTGEKRALATTEFEPADARSAFPCFDEPGFKANFSISIVREKRLTALSNMPVKSTEDFNDKLMLDKFETSPPISTYLVAFIVGDLKSISKVITLENGPVKVSAYASEDNIDNVAFALNISCKSLKFYERVFHVPYPLPKMDLVAIPDFESGAMENWGLITYRETDVLWNPKENSVFEQERVAITVTHELAHQWFGNIVTMKWWNDLWLNEGFASYMEYYAVGSIYPAWMMKNDFNGEHTLAAIDEDSSIYTHPIIVPVSSTVNAEEVFDDISYSKGANLIRMMVDFLGEKLFFSGVRDYLRQYEFNIAGSEDLVRSLAGRTKSEQQEMVVLNMLESWTNNPGVPVINVTLVENEVTLSQMRYMPLPKDDGHELLLCGKGDVTWDIPVSYATNLSPEKEWIFLSEKLIKFRVGNFEQVPDWVLLNANRGGYYVVNYNSDLLRRLIVQLKTNHGVFNALDRSGIIFNAAKSAKAGYLSYGTLFDLLSYLKNEDDYWPVDAAYDIIHRITSSLKMQFEKHVLKAMHEMTKTLFERLYMKYGWPVSNGSNLNLSHPDRKLQKIVVAMMCDANYANCTSTALGLFNFWMKNGIKVHADFMDVVYSTAVRLGPSKNWHYLWEVYKSDSTIEPIEKEKILFALCQTTEEKKIVFLLEEALKDGSIRIQDSGDVFHNLRSTKSGALLTWNFVKDKWNEIQKIYSPGSSSMQNILSAFQSFTGESEIAGAEEFIAKNNMTDVRYVKRALNLAKQNVFWIKNYQPDIVQWLNTNFN